MGAGVGAALLEQVTPFVDVAEVVFLHPEGQDLTPRGAVQRRGLVPVTAFHLESGHLGLLLVVVVVVVVVGVPWQAHFPPEQVLRVPEAQ